MTKCKFMNIYGCKIRQTLNFDWNVRTRIGNFAECMTSSQYGNCQCPAYTLCSKAGVCYDFVKACHDYVLKPYAIREILSYNIVDGIDTQIRSEQELLKLPKGTVLKISDRLRPGEIVKASHSFLYLGKGCVTGTNWGIRTIRASSKTHWKPKGLCSHYSDYFLFPEVARLLGWNIPIRFIHYNGGKFSLYANKQPLNNYLYYKS